MKLNLTFLIFILSINPLLSQNLATSSFDTEWLKSIVSIESINPDGSGAPIGTGFFLTTNNNHIVLITAKHVIQHDGMIQKNLAYRLNEKNGNSILFPVSLAETVNGSSWFLSKDADVACLFAAFKSTSDIKSISAKFNLDNSNIRDGAPVVVPGFPMGIRSEEYSNPIVRSGNVASCDSLNTIIDAFVFPGNSGGPVIYVPYVKVDDKTLKSPFLNRQMLIGIVSSYIPYVDVAISVQTKRPRITFEENTGLCNVVPGYKIIELLNREDVLDAESKIIIIK